MLGLPSALRTSQFVAVQQRERYNRDVEVTFLCKFKAGVAMLILVCHMKRYTRGFNETWHVDGEARNIFFVYPASRKPIGKRNSEGKKMFCRQGLLCAHDAVAQKDYYPRLPEIPLEVDEDEETVKIVQLVKSNEPLVRQIGRTFGT